jgi:hypothetical protein
MGTDLGAIPFILSKKTFTTSIPRPEGPTHISPARQGREPVRSIAQAPQGRHKHAAMDNPDVPPLRGSSRGIPLYRGWRPGLQCVAASRLAEKQLDADLHLCLSV